MAVLCGYLPAGLGLPVGLTLPLGCAAVIALVYFAGKKVEA
jgi:hypothetical protein